MSRSTISTFQLFEMFPDATSARLYLEGRLWPNGATCPTCKSGERITTRKRGFYRCNACNLDFTVRTGTVMDRSHVPLDKWLAAMAMLAEAPDTSSLVLAEQLGITPKSALEVRKRIHEAAEPLMLEHLETNDSLYRLVKDWPGYRVGADGSIWTRRQKGNSGELGFTWRLMTPTKVAHGRNKKGRRVVTLRDRKRKRWVYVHDLVCEAFHGPCPPGQECRHLDGDSLNDAADNLKWGTHTENVADTALHGRLPTGERNGNSKFTDAEIAKIRSLKGVTKRKDVAARFSISSTYVSYLWSGKFRKGGIKIGH